MFETFVQLDLSEPPPFVGALLDELGDLDEADDLRPDELDDLVELVEPPRMRKVGGILTNQLGAAFAALEAAFMASTCICCHEAPRVDGRLMCEPCQVAHRPPRLTPDQVDALRRNGYSIRWTATKSSRRAA